ncbi:MAG: LPXTG cell wall anchor domain-containing protein [Thermoleophilia bacterium]
MTTGTELLRIAVVGGLLLAAGLVMALRGRRKKS